MSQVAKEDQVAQLVKALIREKPHEKLLENAKYLRFACRVLDESERSTRALEVLLDYVDSKGVFPSNIATLIHEVQNNSKHNPKYEKSEWYENQLNAIDDNTEDLNPVDSTALIDSIYIEAYETEISRIYKTAANITIGGQENPHTNERGPNASSQYVAQELEKVVTKDLHRIEGELHENIRVAGDYINKFIAGESERILTGFKNIDEITMIGRKQPNRWIGILGYTHHGKSLFLNSMLYNMAAKGANIMLVPLESSVEDTWMHFVWLHYKAVIKGLSEKEKEKFKIVSRADWMRNGSKVGLTVTNTVNRIIEDLENGNTLPGKIAVYRCKTWKEVVDRAVLSNGKYNFDVLAIDYFAHLDTERGRDSHIDRLKADLRKAQHLSGEGLNGDQSGLVVMTPLQSNREGHKETAKQEGDQTGIYESLNAVEHFSQAAQDMDCVMSVWFEGESCVDVSPAQMVIHCLKGRGNMKFRSHRVQIDPLTGMVEDIGEGSTEAINLHDEDYKSGVSSPETSTVAFDVDWEM